MGKKVGVEMENFRIQGQGASNWGLHGKDQGRRRT
jgi:hypothetical protein